MSACMQNKKCDIKYPTAKKVDTVDVYFGKEVADPYRWLEDDNSTETTEWVEAENKITFEYLDKIPFREQLKERLTEIWNYPKYRVPFKRGDKYFIQKNDGIQNQDILYIMDNIDAELEVLLDPNSLSEDGTVALSDISVSKDGKYLGYSISLGGSDWNEIYVLEIESGKLLKDHVKWVKFSGIAWKDDGFFYSSYDEPDEEDVLSGQNRFHKVYYHKLGTEQEDDNIAFYGFTSFTFPSSIYTYDIENNSSEIYKASELNFDSEAYETQQVFFESKDGTKVPMFIVNKKGIKLDGNNPTIGNSSSLTNSPSIV